MILSCFRIFDDQQIDRQAHGHSLVELHSWQKIHKSGINVIVTTLSQVFSSPVVKMIWQWKFLIQKPEHLALLFHSQKRDYFHQATKKWCVEVETKLQRLASSLLMVNGLPPYNWTMIMIVVLKFGQLTKIQFYWWMIQVRNLSTVMELLMYHPLK